MEERFVKQEEKPMPSVENKPPESPPPAETLIDTRAPLPSPSEPAPPGTQSLFVLAIIAFATAVSGAIFVFAVGQIKGLVSYVITLIVAIPMMAFLLSRLRANYPVPFDCAVVLERMGTPIVMWGPGTVDKWPFIDQVRAIVPLCSLQYTCPKQKVFTKPDEAIEIRLVVSYGVNSKDWNSANVLKAVYHTQEGTMAKDKGQADSKGKSVTRTITDLKQTWEKRLLFDIIMTLNEILPGENLGASSHDQYRRRIISNNLRKSLSLRVQEWGMEIEEISIMELGWAKV
jgi:regulator of protease activity HflC (stomatin/prohibitin superfamily)